LAFPCATQNELLKNDAIALVKNGCIAVSEGANIAGFEKVAKAMLAFGVI